VEGKIIINTRPLASEDRITEALEELGLNVLLMPLTEILPLTIPDQAQNDIFLEKKYTWLIFTSQNGVNSFFDCLLAKRWTQTLPFHTAVFGERTAETLLAKGWKPDLVNRGNSAIQLIPDLLSLLSFDDKVLLVLGDLAPHTLLEKLKEKVVVDRINAYATLATAKVDESILKRIARGEYDLILFTSPSGVKSFAKLAKDTSSIDLKTLKAVSLGRSTTEALLSESIVPRVEAFPSGKEGLVSKLKEYFNADNF